MIKAYFFDWMGTLANHENRRYQEILTNEESDLLMTSKLKKVISDKNKRKLIHNLLATDIHYVYPDSECIIDFLKSKGYKVSIVSNMYEITTKKIRKLFPEFLSKFDVVSLSAEIGMKKPQEDIFFYTLNELNKTSDSHIQPNEVMMIGDRCDKDIEPVFKLGMHAKLIDRKKQNLTDIITWEN